MDINSADSFTNTGTVSVSGSGALNIFSNITPENMTGIGGVGGGGAVNIDGALYNVGTTFNVVSSGIVVGHSGTIHGGTIVDPSGLLGGYGGTLSGVTYDGTLALGANMAGGVNQYLFVIGGLTLKNATGTGNGMATLGGAKGNGTLILNDTETLDNATINLVGVNGHYGGLSGNGTSVTFGSNLTINSSGAGGNYIGARGDNIVNQGTINVTSGTLYIQPTTFTNIGAIVVSSRRPPQRSPPARCERSSPPPCPAAATPPRRRGRPSRSTEPQYPDAADRPALSGAGLGVGDQQSEQWGHVADRHESHAYRKPDGSLILLANRGLTNTSAFSDSGLLQLGGGTFKTNSLTVATTGMVLGYGWVTSTVINSGLIEAKGGKLALTQALTGTGTMQIDAGATLELGAASAEAVSFGGAVGTLKLDSPSSFTGVISGLVAGDVIDLVGKTTTGLATLVGTTLSVPTSSGVLTFNFNGAPPGSFRERSDGSTGTDLVFSSDAAGTLTTGIDHVTQNNVVISAAADTLSTGDIIAPGGSTNTLQLTGSGTFDLRSPLTLIRVGVVNAVEGVSKPQIWLRNGMNVVLNIASGGAGTGVAITGAHNSSTINLGRDRQRTLGIGHRDGPRRRRRRRHPRHRRHGGGAADGRDGQDDPGPDRRRRRYDERQ